MKNGVFVLVIVVTFMLSAGSVFCQTETEFLTAVEHYKSGEYETTIAYLKDYIAAKPDPLAYYLIGYSLYKLERHDEAAHYFKEAYLIDPYFSPTRLDILISDTGDAITNREP